MFSCAIVPCAFPLQVFFREVPVNLSVSPLWSLWEPDRSVSPGNSVSAQIRHTLSLQQVSRTLHTEPRGMYMLVFLQEKPVTERGWAR